MPKLLALDYSNERAEEEIRIGGGGGVKYGLRGRSLRDLWIHQTPGAPTLIPTLKSVSWGRQAVRVEEGHENLTREKISTGTRHASKS